MSTAAQNIDSAYGLNKDARLAATRSAALTEAANKPALDPDYPFYVIGFDAGYYGEPEEITG